MAVRGAPGPQYRGSSDPDHIGRPRQSAYATALWHRKGVRGQNYARAATRTTGPLDLPDLAGYRLPPDWHAGIFGGRGTHSLVTCYTEIMCPNGGAEDGLI